jgi:hypothetical protein
MRLKYWTGRVKQRDRTTSVLRASTRAMRSRGLQVVLGLTVFSGAALAQTYFRFELINTATTGDRHILVGRLAVTAPVNGGGSFLTPNLSLDSSNWTGSFNAGVGGVPSTNYAITRIGGWAGGPTTAFAASYGCNSPCTTAFVSSINMGWTDVSGASFIVTGTGTSSTSSFQIYNASWNSVTGTYDTVGGPITPPGTGTPAWSIVYQGTDLRTGGFDTLPSEYGPTLFPEINGSALPKAALLVFSLYLMARARRSAQ